MDPARRLLHCALTGLALGTALAALGALGDATGRLASLHAWPAAHAWILIAGALLPAFAYLQFRLLDAYLGARLHDDDARLLAGLYSACAVLIPLGVLFPGAAAPIRPFAVAGFSGFLLLAGTGLAQMLMLRRLIPRSSVVDVARDPLTKGDDACLMQLRMAHMFLPAGLVLLALSNGPGLDDWAASPHLRLAGLHLVLAAYGLLATYGVSHLVVPRLTGVPAIAAGAIKGELHSSLLGFVLLAAGFVALGTPFATGLLIGGGVFVFFGAFVFMGVLGANIMKNKSRTQRVTPEFAYVPWTFAGVFWLVAGVLLGIFLNAVPDLFADRLPALRFVHVHAIALGGFVLLLLGFAMRTIGPATIPFSRTKLAFYLLNLGLIVMALAAVQQGKGSPGVAVGAALAALGLAAWFIGLAPHLRVRSSR